jgi:CheY-like chemotaxis protein
MQRRPLKRILLVEDDPDIQEVTTLLLSEIGDFEVQACGGAADGLAMARVFNPDLILLDVIMPGLGGQAALTAFRKMPETASTPVIFMTARVQPDQISEYRNLGSLGVIPKPFDPETLFDTIQEMWDRHEKARLNAVRREDLAALRRSYATDLPDRLKVLEEAAATLTANGWDAQAVANLYEVAHRLAGSAAIYGFPAVSDAAMRISAFSERHSGTWEKLDPKPLLKLVETLKTAIQQSLKSTDRLAS